MIETERQIQREVVAFCISVNDIISNVHFSPFLFFLFLLCLFLSWARFCMNASKTDICMRDINWGALSGKTSIKERREQHWAEEAFRL